MSYLFLKHLHLSAVTLSLGFFLLRGGWMLLDSAMLQRRWVRVLPHLVDSVLLLSAIAMTLQIRQYPFTADWLTAKVIALLLYIMLGSVALKRGRTRTIRMTALLGAILCAGYIVGVALTRDPRSWLVF